MESRKLGARNGEAVRQAIELGEVVHIETAREECTDALLLCAIDRGLLTTWAETCPDPRSAPERGMAVICPAHIAGRFAGLYSLRQAGYVLRSARVLGALGSRGEVSEPAQGVSFRGTAEDTLFRGEVVRTLLGNMEEPADLSQPAQRPPTAPSVAVTGRERASRRAVKQAVEEAEAAARAQQVAAPWVGWSTQPGGGSRRKSAPLGTGSRRHMLATTPGEVA